MKKFFTLIAVAFVALSVNAYEITLWETGGEAKVRLNSETAEWQNTFDFGSNPDAWIQYYFLSDEGGELSNAGAAAGEKIVFYAKMNGESGYQVQIHEGHWGGQYAWFSNDVATDPETGATATIADLNTDGSFSLELTQEILDAAFTKKWWGGTFVLQGYGLEITKVVLVKEGDAPVEPVYENIDIIDRFTYTWNPSESLAHNEDKSITFNSVSWGGLAAYYAVKENPEDENSKEIGADWSEYDGIVFEFAEPTTVNTQILIQPMEGDNISAWGNPGITSLTLMFEGKNVSSIKQIALQTSAATTLVITKIYFLKKSDASAIQKIDTKKSQGNNAIYNLAGQKVNAQYKGVVIKNGKKVMQ
ncbi:MAG: hypothetical protein IJ891_03595 [Prevotella sp.]|nr:hypothetical protein [Prevotella sp.]